MSNILVVYYSYSETTQALAETIAILTNGDLRPLVPENPYQFNYNGATKEARSEIDRGFCPKLASGIEAIDDYEYIFIGSPNWFKSYAPPILSFLRDVHLEKKTIIPFCTHGGGGFGHMLERFSEECPHSNHLRGFDSTSDIDEEQVESWLRDIGLLA